MAQIPTAENVIRSQFCEGEFDEIMGYLNNSIEPSIKQAMIEFAKMHVEAALKEASEKVTWKMESFDTYFGDSRAFDFIDTDYAGDPSTGHNVLVDKDSILNSYPLSNIK